ncbi:MAG: LON peptidase substrate-binding domain-containing protein, partial [Thermodesulfobacteriota bacterium]
MIFLPRGGADRDEKSKDDKVVVPEELPILPLRGTVLYPDLILPIMVGRKKSVKLIDDAMDSDRIIGVITQKRSEIEDPKESDLYSV